MSEPIIVVDKKDQIATVTLNRPQAMNAFSSDMWSAFADVVNDLKNDQSIAVIILTGAGRAFCAGLDLKELAGAEKALDRMSEGKMEGMQPGDDSFTALERINRPVIGAINGFAITGGFELALSCDILIASTEAKFADTHMRVGILPGAGLSQKLSRIVGLSRAKEISLTGNFIGAQQALDWGLVNRVVPPDELLPTCRSLAEDILSGPQDAARRYLKLIDDGYKMTLTEGLELEKEVSLENMKSVTQGDISQRREGILKRGRQQSE
jgi:enoyl-CoA hydratase